MTSEQLTPRKEHRFTFGLWTVGNPGRDPFGEPTRAPLDPVHSVHRLAELGAWGVSLHDDDLVPWGTPAAERDRIVARFRRALDETGLGVGMATTNLFTHPAFKDGAFTSNDRAVRRAAIGKAMRSIDLGAELGAEVYVFWGGREGTEAGVAKDPRDALERFREALDTLAEYVVEQGYHLRFALEPKPNEPRGDIFLPTVGHALHFITTLQRPEMVGVNPEVAHETMAGLSFHHAVGQALWAGKLFHIDLNAQRIGRYDQDFRFGAEDLKEAFLLVRLLERAGYAGPRHFDAHAYRNEDADGVWDFAAGCMRTYLTLAEKARRFDALPEVQQALEAAGALELGEPTVGAGDDAATLKAEVGDLDALATRGFANERLDQLLVEVLLGAR
jgi:xylose isomerase